MSCRLQGTKEDYGDYITQADKKKGENIMAINAKTRGSVDNAVVNESNNLRVCLERWTDIKEGIDGASDPALTALGYDAGEITQLRNIATGLGNILTTMTANEAPFKAVSDIILF